jgi:hypothetical protein
MKTIKLENCSCFDKENVDNKFQNQGMMKCLKGAKWVLLIPGILVTLAFLLGYVLEPPTIRILWLIITGSLIVLGTIFYASINIWRHKLQRNSTL